MIIQKQLKAVRNTILVSLMALAVSEAFVYLSSLMLRPPLKGLENQITDLAFQVRDENEAHKKYSTQDIVIIDIDDESIEILGRPQFWPRAFDAFAISVVSAGNPAAIGMDYLYTETDSLSRAYIDLLQSRGFQDAEGIINAFSTDMNLASSIKESNKVYLAMFNKDNGDTSTTVSTEFLRTLDGKIWSNHFPKMKRPELPIDIFIRNAKGVGAIDMPTEQDGTVRNYQLLNRIPSKEGEKVIANFPFYMLLDQFGVEEDQLKFSNDGLYLNDTLSIPLNENGSFRINWLGEEEKIRSISFHKILSGRIPIEYFADKFVFFGTSASGMGDLKTVPPKESTIPGVEVHAIAFLNMLNGAFIDEVSDLQALPWFFLVSIFMVSICFLLRPFLGFLFTVLSILAELYYFILYHLPDQHSFFPIASLMLITFFSYLFASLFIYFIKERKSRRLKMAFGSYVSREVVEQIAKENRNLKLGGEKKELTVLFSDIRSFTSISEKLEPEEIVQLLNEYLSKMTECIFDEKGTIDKYIGDAIMAIFGAPIDQEDHAQRACRVAIAMITNLEQLNKERLSRGEDKIEIGIGINTGEMTVGNIGSKRRFDYTVIGDEVNLASRLEGLTKIFGASILISDATLKRIDQKAFIVRYLGKVVVKGRSLPTGLYEISPDDFDLNRLSIWNDAMRHFESAHIEEAMELFEKYQQSLGCPDRSAALFLGRCSEALNDIENFSSILVLDTK